MNKNDQRPISIRGATIIAWGEEAWRRVAALLPRANPCNYDPNKLAPGIVPGSIFPVRENHGMFGMFVYCDSALVVFTIGNDLYNMKANDYINNCKYDPIIKAFISAEPIATLVKFEVEVLVALLSPEALGVAAKAVVSGKVTEKMVSIAKLGLFVSKEKDNFNLLLNQVVPDLLVRMRKFEKNHPALFGVIVVKSVLKSFISFDAVKLVSTILKLIYEPPEKKLDAFFRAIVTVLRNTFIKSVSKWVSTPETPLRISQDQLESLQASFKTAGLDLSPAQVREICKEFASAPKDDENNLRALEESLKKTIDILDKMKPAYDKMFE
jgi:hypothetical protein